MYTSYLVICDNDVCGDHCEVNVMFVKGAGPAAPTPYASCKGNIILKKYPLQNVTNTYLQARFGDRTSQQAITTASRCIGRHALGDAF